MPAAVSDIIRVAAIMKYNGVDDIVNVFHFRIIATPTPNTNVNLLSDVGEHFGAAYAQIEALMPDEVAASAIHVYNITQDAPVGLGSWGTDFTGGTGTGEPMPTHDACMVLWGTDVKRRVGRTYLGPFTEGNHSGSFWSGAAVSAVGLWAAEMRQESAWGMGSELRLGVYARSSGAHSLITSVRIQPLVSTQTRRRIGRGS